LKALENIGGYSTVFQRGASPCFVFKEASSTPKVIGLRGKACRGLTRFNTADCERGFACIDVDVWLPQCVKLISDANVMHRTSCAYVSFHTRSDMETWVGLLANFDLEKRFML
jgi:hypothetical protein